MRIAAASRKTVRAVRGPPRQVRSDDSMMDLDQSSKFAIEHDKIAVVMTSRSSNRSWPPLAWLCVCLLSSARGTLDAACPKFEAYKAMHERMLRGEGEARWLVTGDVSSFASSPMPSHDVVAGSQNDGIADRYINAVSTFLIALITKRALCITAHPAYHSQPGLQEALDAPGIDWTCPGAANICDYLDVSPTFNCVQERHGRPPTQRDSTRDWLR